MNQLIPKSLYKSMSKELKPRKPKDSERRDIELEVHHVKLCLAAESHGKHKDVSMDKARKSKSLIPKILYGEKCDLMTTYGIMQILKEHKDNADIRCALDNCREKHIAQFRLFDLVNKALRELKNQNK